MTTGARHWEFTRGDGRLGAQLKTGLDSGGTLPDPNRHDSLGVALAENQSRPCEAQHGKPGLN